MASQEQHRRAQEAIHFVAGCTDNLTIADLLNAVSVRKAADITSAAVADPDANTASADKVAADDSAAAAAGANATTQSDSKR